ncbi:biosynthetic-type acetolactate synthase large subunit [bacterium]|nr:biosynthetic-type acetolactate synthase large subunit [bacterium]
MLTKRNTKILTGSKVIIETLKSLGTDTIFGYPGGIVLGLYDELYKQSHIKHILVRHEQSAVHCAEGYARVTGKCGVVLVTSGPGATNTVTGIVNAYLDGSPLVVLTGQVSEDLIGTDAFQEANICDITKSCTKAAFQITSAKNIQEILIEAFNIANSGKKGPVVVDMSKNIFSESAEFREVNFTNAVKTCKIDYSKILKRLLSSSKPVIVTGGGVTHSGADLYSAIKNFDIPVVSTMMGLGTYPQNDKNYFGMIGIFGDKSANEILKKSDLIISLGARFNDRITCMFDKSELESKFIQIDINEKEIARVLKPVEFLVCDIKDFINELSSVKINFSNWADSVQSLKDLNIKRKKTTNLLHSFEVIRKIEEFTKNKDIIFTSEVGQHQLWAVQNLTFNKERRILVSGGSGTMGFGFPSAIGACIASPEKTVVCITGDGSLQMSLGELSLCRDYNLNLKIIILNNGYLGMVRQLQQKNCDGRYSQTKISNPDFVHLAQSYGLKALKVNNMNEIDSALKQAFLTKETFIIDFHVEPMEVL